MTLAISHVTFDVHDPATVSDFWAAATGFAEDPEGPNAPGDDEYLIQSADGATQLLFIRVPEGKAVKNRVHFDLKPTDSTRDAEVLRMLRLGATVYDDRRLPDGRGWVVMLDPEGNEFCVERADSERAK